MKTYALLAFLIALLPFAFPTDSPSTKKTTDEQADSKTQRAESPDNDKTTSKKPDDAGRRPPLSARKGKGRAVPDPHLPIYAIKYPPAEEMAEAKRIGLLLQERLQKGKLILQNTERNTRQVQQLAEFGYFLSPQNLPARIDPALLRTLDRLSLLATPAKPMELLSFYRPLSSGMHSRGMAMDISAYGGYRIHSDHPEECVKGVLAIIAALEPGNYRLGLPKPPDTDPVAFLPPPVRPKDWPFFPAPLPQVDGMFGFVMPCIENGKVLQGKSGQPRPMVLQWENERYAPLSDVGARVQTAIEKAIARGVNIHSLFPDALDHLHLDTKPEP